VINGDSGRRALAALHLIFRLSGAFLVGALNDDGVYVVLAKAIVQGDGYRSIHLVAAPVQVRYPPGLRERVLAPPPDSDTRVSNRSAHGASR
jgi:hypothetical protein